MTTFIAANLSLLFIVVVVGLIERAHRHVSGTPHAPLGADYSRDADLQRVLHDLDVARR